MRYGMNRRLGHYDATDDYVKSINLSMLGTTRSTSITYKNGSRIWLFADGYGNTNNIYTMDEGSINPWRHNMRINAVLIDGSAQAIKPFYTGYYGGSTYYAFPKAYRCRYVDQLAQ